MEVRGIRERVVRFIRERREPVSCEDLRLRFVKKLGFRHATVLGVTASEAILRYLNGFLVHVETLGWNAEKQAELAKTAEAYYDLQVRAGGLLARVDRLLEMHETSLPALANGMTWTPTLLAALLARDARTPVVGTMENAFVFNKDGISVRSFPDLVDLVLERHFDGAASVTQLSEWLREERVIHRVPEAA